MVIDDVSAGAVAAAVEELVPDATPVHPASRLRKGRSHVSWVLASAQGYLVGKVATRPFDSVVGERLAEHERAWALGVPVPALRAWTAASAAVGGRMVVVAEYLPGWDAEEAVPRLSQAQAHGALAAAGHALARLHQVPVESFGRSDTGLGSGSLSWSEYVAGRVESLDQAYRASEVGHESLVNAGLKLLWHLADEVSSAVTPAVAHLDVYLPNLLLDDAGSLQVLLDLEHVRHVDAAMDFVKPAMWIFEDRPELADPFLDGYQTVAGLGPRWAERVSVATGLELLTGVEYWTRVGAPDMFRDYLRRLQGWVRSEGVDSAWANRSLVTR